MIQSFSSNKFPVVIIDIPWQYYGDKFKPMAAGKHYDCMTDEEIYSLPVKDILLPKSVLFVWVTGPKLAVAINAIHRWGLHYRGIAFDWAKTTAQGKFINGQGGRPSLIKHAGELVLWASPLAKGKPLPIKNEGMASWYIEEEIEIPIPELIPVPRPQNVHSRKPEEIQNRIEALLDGPYLEIFARRQRAGWECFGNQIHNYEKKLQNVSPEEFNKYAIGTFPAFKPLREI